MYSHVLTLSAALIFLYSEAWAADNVRIESVTKEKIGELVRVEGTTSDFKPSHTEKAPNSFILKDGSGTIRVAIWPDEFNKITSKDLISKGVQLSLEAEVAEFRGIVELHVKDAVQVKVSAGVPAATVSAGSVSTTTSTTVTTGTK